MHRGHVERIFEVLLVGLFLVLGYTALFKSTIFPDILFLTFIVLAIRWYGHGKLGCWTVTTILAAVFIHVAGSFGMYGQFLYGTIGYDKLVHLVSGIAIGAFVLEESTEPLNRRIILTLLIVLGAGAATEITEFIGSHYFGINNGGIFTISDGLPIVSDLQRYDTYYDLLTNLLGGLIAVLVWAPQLRKRK